MIQFRMSTDTWERTLASRRRRIEEMYPDKELWYSYECLEYTEFSAYNDSDFGFKRMWRDGHLSNL